MSRRIDWDRLRRQEKAARPELQFKAPDRRKVRVTLRLMTVRDLDNLYSARWAKRKGAWECVGADAAIAWMVGMSPKLVQHELTRLGFAWIWARK